MDPQAVKTHRQGPIKSALCDRCEILGIKNMKIAAISMGIIIDRKQIAGIFFVVSFRIVGNGIAACENWFTDEMAIISHMTYALPVI